MAGQTCRSSTLLLAVCHFVTWLLSFNVVFNYMAATTGSAGSVKDCDESQLKEGDPIPKVRARGLVGHERFFARVLTLLLPAHQGIFENYNYCYHCKYFKPPSKKAAQCSISDLTK